MPEHPIEEDLVIVLKRSKKGQNPAHLKPYQEKMRRFAPLCAKEVAHLKGEKRVVRYFGCIARRMKEEDGEEREDNHSE